jgi:hypothetical protein
MFLIRVVSVSLTGRHNGDEENARSGWRRQIWQTFMAWLLEPIPFPGKTYHLDPDVAYEKRESLKGQAQNELANVSVKNLQ